MCKQNAANNILKSTPCPKFPPNPRVRGWDRAGESSFTVRNSHVLSQAPPYVSYVHTSLTSIRLLRPYVSYVHTSLTSALSILFPPSTAHRPLLFHQAYSLGERLLPMPKHSAVHIVFRLKACLYTHLFPLSLVKRKMLGGGRRTQPPRPGLPAGYKQAMQMCERKRACARARTHTQNNP
jgi:hypothetical protein